MTRLSKISACVVTLAIGLTLSVALAKDKPPVGVTVQGMVHAIRLPEAPVQLPPGKGRETVAVQCAVCHTLAYIPMQPKLSREAWTAVVTKMQKTYSAPIADDKIAEIVDYCVEIRGATPKK